MAKKKLRLLGAGADPDVVSLSKLLLESVDDSLSGISVYQKYLETFTLADADTNLSSLSGRPKVTQKLLDSMYKIRSSAADPAFFSFHSCHDLVRLSVLLKRELVIYSSTSANTMHDVDLFHDFRFVAAGGRRARLERDSKKPPLVFLVTQTKNLFKLDPVKANSFDLNYNFLSEKTVNFADSWGSTLSALTGLAQPPTEHLSVLPSDLQEYRHELHQLWREPVLFVALCKTALRSRTNKRLKQRPESQHFVTIALVAPPLSQLSHLDLQSVRKVVCFIGGSEGSCQKLCLLNELFRKHVLKQFIKTTHKDKVLNKNVLDLPAVSRLELAAAENKVKEARSKKRQKYVTKAEKQGRKCACEICSASDFDANMAKCGPEKLITYTLDVSELLALLGLDTPSNLDAVKEMCSLSVASMDIESTTIELDLERPVNAASGVQHQVVDGVTLEGHLQKIQKPLMIAHLDELMLSGEPHVFVVKSDEEEAIHTMMVDYWKFVRRRQNECQIKKESLAEPMLKVVQAYSLAHLEFHRTWTGTLDEADSNCSSSWKNSLPGKLQTALAKLIRNYAVFSFYG